MSPHRPTRADALRLLRRFRTCESGAYLVEYALVVLLFLFLLFAMIDFGRLSHATVAANKATQIAARTAAVRPLACVPPDSWRYQRGAGSDPFDFGTMCRHEGITDICEPPVDPNLTCLGSATDPTAAEIFAAVRPLLPANAGIENLRFTYTFDPNLGFLGGPYIPMITVEMVDVGFLNVAPLGRITGTVNCGASSEPAHLCLPRIQVSLPAEDIEPNVGG